MSLNPIDVCMRQGAVFRMRYAFDAEKPKYRYFIVMNQSPTTDPIILLLSPTTQLEKKDRLYAKSDFTPLVWMHPNDYPELETLCVVDCRASRKFDRAELLEMMGKKGFVFLKPLPDFLLQRIIDVMVHDRTIPNSVKRIITNTI